MSNDAAEKVVEASPDKKRRARQKGDVPISQEANTAAALLGFLLSLLIAVPQAQGLAVRLRGFLLRPEDAGGAMLRGDLASEVLVAGSLFLLPIIIFPAGAVLIALAVQQSIVVAPSRIKPDINKISPVKGAGKKFGPQALLDFAKNSVKILILTVVGGFLLYAEAKRIAFAFDSHPILLAQLLLREMTVFLGAAILIAALFALIDIPLVTMQREKRLKMSVQEQKDEAKENEGDASVKAQRRQRAEKIATSQMIKDVQSADVLITNPTHYAVALTWDRSGEDLPRCVAKGTDDVALRLRAAARDAGVPIRDDPPAARSLYAVVEVGEPIKTEHFAAVAAAIRFADRVRSARP